MSSRSINIFCLLGESFQQDAGSAKSFRPMTNGSISVPESFICGKVDQRLTLLTLLTLLIHGIAREFFSADSNCSGQKSIKQGAQKRLPHELAEFDPDSCKPHDTQDGKLENETCHC